MYFVFPSLIFFHHFIHPALGPLPQRRTMALELTIGKVTSTVIRNVVETTIVNLAFWVFSVSVDGFGSNVKLFSRLIWAEKKGSFAKRSYFFRILHCRQRKPVPLPPGPDHTPLSFLLYRRKHHILPASR